MVTLLNIFIGLLWFVSALLDDSAFCYLWQLKEYRVDRMREFFRTRSGKSFWISYPMLVRSALAIIVFFWPLNDVSFVKAALIAVFVLDAGRGMLAYNRKSLQRPQPTMKAVSIIALSLGIEGGVFLLSRDWTVLFLLLIARFYLVSAAALLMAVPTRIMKRRFLARAKKKLEQCQKLMMIGITGSYGKTSVKTILAHILSGAKRVIATPEHVNTDIGIAQFILKTDVAHADIFIVEMGAYKKGEIRIITDMVKPTIGILTAINEQHLSLFGSMENIQAAKYELLRSLPKNGLAIVNRDHPYAMEFLHELAAPSETFGTEESVEKTNIAPCLIVARRLGMSDEEIAERLKTLPSTTLRVFTYGQALVIDDSYNSNPDGFLAALRALESLGTKKQRVVVTRGMLELGTESDALHKKIGHEIGRVADALILVNRDAERPIVAGIGSARTRVSVYERPADLLAALQAFKHTQSVILLQNRMPEIIAKEVTAV